MENRTHWGKEFKRFVGLDKDLLYSTGNSAQYSVMSYMRKESEKEWIYVHVKLIHFALQHTHDIVNQLHANKSENKKDLQI